METITIPVLVGEERRLILDLPASVPVGPAEVVIRPRTSSAGTQANDAREALRAKLLAAGFLSTAAFAPPEAIPLSNDDLVRLGQLAPGARPSEDLIDEDRGMY
jgi:hypothetical protein